TSQSGSPTCLFPWPPARPPSSGTPLGGGAAPPPLGRCAPHWHRQRAGAGRAGPCGRRAAAPAPPPPPPPPTPRPPRPPSRAALPRRDYAAVVVVLRGPTRRLGAPRHGTAGPGNFRVIGAKPLLIDIFAAVQAGVAAAASFVASLSDQQPTRLTALGRQVLEA